MALRYSDRLRAAELERDILLIRMNNSRAGFFAQVQFAINQIRYAEAKGMVPVVHFGPDSINGPNAYYEESAGPNVWEYYFEPVADLTLDQARELIRRTGRRLLTLNYWELWRLHHWEPRSVFTYPYGYFRHVDDKTTRFDSEWWAQQRARGRRLVRRYVRVRPEIRRRVGPLRRRSASGRPCSGSTSGAPTSTDVGAGARLARIVPPEEYYPFIDAFLDEHPDAGVFVATDQLQFRDMLARRYCERVVWYSAMLSQSDVGIFQMREPGGRGNRDKGEEVLVDALLLARCTRLLKCTSAVGEFAQYFADTLEATDLNFVGVDDPPQFSPWTTLRRGAMRAELEVRRVVFGVRGLALEDADAPGAPRSVSDRCLPSWARAIYRKQTYRKPRIA